MRTRTTLAALAILAMAGCTSEKVTQPQEAPDALLAKVAGANQGGRPLFTTLSGLEEVPPRNTPGSGTFRATLNQGQGLICYELTVRDLLGPVVGAHIHKQDAGFNGPIVVHLEQPHTGFSSGCVEASKELIKDIRQNPEGYYVNVHTTVFPPGEIRGQLGK